MERAQEGVSISYLHKVLFAHSVVDRNCCLDWKGEVMCETMAVLLVAVLIECLVDGKTCGVDLAMLYLFFDAVGERDCKVFMHIVGCEVANNVKVCLRQLLVTLL